jgi:hypothetical protein
MIISKDFDLSTLGHFGQREKIIFDVLTSQRAHDYLITLFRVARCRPEAKNAHSDLPT